MVRALRERTITGPGGRVLIDRSNLLEGAPAEVIVLVDDASAGDCPARPLSSYVGALARQFDSVAEADAHVRELRDEWDRP